MPLLIRNSNVFECVLFIRCSKTIPMRKHVPLLKSIPQITTGINFYSVTRLLRCTVPFRVKNPLIRLMVGTPGSQALLQLQDGEYTDIIEQDHGFFIYERVSYRGPEYVKFENARSTILMELFEQEKNREALDLYRKLQEKLLCW